MLYPLHRLSLLAGLACLVPSGFSSVAAMSLTPAADVCFRHEGRFDRTDPAQPVMIWAGDRLSVGFEGSALALVFGVATGQAFFNVTVDGITEIVGVPAGEGHRFAWPHALAPGRHALALLKRSEADAGHAAFRGIELARGAQVFAPTAPAYRFRLQFIGDSITAGANNEDGAVDQWEDRRTHNHALSYGFLTSQELGADHRAVAVSGMGLCEGFVPMVAGDTWDKIYPRDNPLRANLAAWVPDVVCVNLGENDAAFTRVNGRPFPAGFTAAYTSLVRAVRAAWPQARIVLLRGGMGGGKNDPRLHAAWAAAVRELEAGDPRISHFIFDHWSELHPRVSDHRAMAAELTAWLQRQPWLVPFLKPYP